VQAGPESSVKMLVAVFHSRCEFHG
jgi:hypothetical protein